MCIEKKKFRITWVTGSNNTVSAHVRYLVRKLNIYYSQMTTQSKIYYSFESLPEFRIKVNTFSVIKGQQCEKDNRDI